MDINRQQQQQQQQQPQQQLQQQQQQEQPQQQPYANVHLSTDNEPQEEQQWRQQQQQQHHQQRQPYANVQLSADSQPRSDPHEIRNERHPYGNVSSTGNTYEALQRRQQNDASTYTELMTSSRSQDRDLYLHPVAETVDEGETFWFIFAYFQINLDDRMNCNPSLVVIER